MATIGDIRQRVFENLYSARLQERPFVELLNGAIDGTTTSVVVDDGGNWAKGDILEVSTTGEQMYVAAVATNTLTVVRGWNGTSGTSAADDDPVSKNPRFTIEQVDTHVTNIMRELEGYGVHSWGTNALTLVTDQYDYDLAQTDILEISSVYYDDDDGETRPLPFTWTDNLNSGIAAQQHHLTLYHWGDKDNGDTIHYTYKQKLDDLANVLPRQEELLVMGATLRLLGATLATRTHDPGKHSDRTVQPGQGGRDARFYQTEYIMAVRREQALLKVEASRQPHSVRSSRASRWRS